MISAGYSLERLERSDSNSELKPQPLPWRPIIVLLLLNGVQPLAYELVFPFISQYERTQSIILSGGRKTIRIATQL